MLQWFNGSDWGRAYWGANLIDLGTDGTNSRRFAGPNVVATPLASSLTVEEE